MHLTWVIHFRVIGLRQNAQEDGGGNAGAMEERAMETMLTSDTILDGHRMQPAIYAIEHISSGKRLICSTRCLSKRLWDQRRRLDRRQHPNHALDAELTQGGPEGFIIVVLELVEDHRTLPQRKRHHLEQARAGNGTFNAPEPSCRKAVMVAPTAAPMTGVNELLDRLDQLERMPADSSEDRAARVKALIEEVRNRLHP